MKPLVVRRSPVACYLLATAAFAAHVLLCYPAAVRRGYPPIHPFWEYVAPYLAYLAIVLFPLFDDRGETLRKTKLIFLSSSVLMNGIVSTNLGSGRPSIGHLCGISGILTGVPVMVALDSLSHAILVLPIGLGVCMLAEQAWSHIRGFADEGDDRAWLRFTTSGLLGGVAIISGLCGVYVWSAHVYRTRPNATWSHACRNHLRHIGLAMQNYASVYGCFPPAYVADEEGLPRHSWRVLLLPFLDEKELYKAYRFDEPWNGPHNRLLAERIPEVYRCRWDVGDQATCTSYLAVIGDETAFPGDRSLSPTAIGNGTSDTILVVESPASASSGRSREICRLSSLIEVATRRRRSSARCMASAPTLM